ncbi:NmrA-like family protein [Xylaria sp. CBS 124048]|nr:NmrA-like family protein [Xylaria sp. CBS 124048]
MPIRSFCRTFCLTFNPGRSYTKSATMAALRKVMVIGASTKGMSNVGSFVVNELKADPAFEVTVLSRKSSSTAPEGVKTIKIDDSFPPEELEQAFAGQDAVVMTTSFQIYGQEGKFIDAAVKAGIKRFIPSEYGSNTRNANTLGMFPMMSAKAKVISQLQEKESTGLSWTAVATGMLVDIGLSTGFMGFDLKGHTAKIWDDGNHKFSSSTRQNIARSISGVLKHPEQTANKYVFTSSFEVSMNDLVASLEKAQGTKYTLAHTTTAEEVADGKAMLAKGEFMKAGKLVLAANLTPGCGNNFALEERLWNEELGVPREDLDKVIADIVKA